MAWPTFWMEPTDRVSVGLRRFRHTEKKDVTCHGGYHDSGILVIVEDAPASEWLEQISREGRQYDRTIEGRIANDDPRWPTRCDECMYEFTEEDARQVWAQKLYAGALDGKKYPLRDLPIGALYDATWFHGIPQYCGEDGIALHCVLPPDRHPWHIDGPASNCTDPKDTKHKCWVRHGDPRTQPVTVDKKGVTCKAGGGSILTPKYHGFLRNGVLTDGC